jgi:hypothetical protein
MVLVAVMVLAFASVLGYVSAMEDGRFNSYSSGCTCHNPTFSATVLVTITGLPASYTPGQTYTVTVTVSGGPPPGGANAEGGFNLFVSDGTLAVPGGAVDVQVNGPARQATHTLAGNDQRSWNVEWHAPAAGAGTVDFQAAAMSVNGDGAADAGDEWAQAAVVQVLEGAALPDPNATVTYPNGGEDITGLSVHDITFDLVDPDDPNDQLLVWVNYSLNGGVAFTTVPGAQGIPGAANPNTVQWTLPGVNTTLAMVSVDVKDPTGLSATDMSDGTFEIDTSPPTILSSTPVGNNIVITTDVRVEFNESMNTTSAEAAFSLKDTATWTLVPGTFSHVSNVMIFLPDSDLQLGTEFAANVTTGAMDDSDPGNSMFALYTWTFTTASTGDFVLPTISDVTALPSPQEYPGAVNISAIVQDDVSLESAWVNVTYPGAAGYLEDVMAYDSTNDRYYFESSYPLVGTYDFTVFANDTNTNLNSSTGHTFDIEDTTPPDITHVPVSLSFANDTINITANVVDLYGLAPVNPVWLDYTNVSGNPSNVSMMTTGGGDFWWEIAAQLIEGEVNYSIWATDEYGNEVVTAVFTIQIVLTDTFPPEILNVQALPSPQEVYEDVNISATVRDLSLPLTVWVVVTQSGTEIYNETMTEGINDVFYMEDRYDIVGTYDFTIWAEDNGSVRNSSSDHTFDIVDTTPPAAPTGLSVAAGDSAGTLEITWTANTELDIDGYDLYRSDTGANNTFSKVNTAPIAGTSYTDSGLEDNTTYYYMLKAVDDQGLESNFSHPADGTTIIPGAVEEDYMWLYALIAILVILVVIFAAASAARKKPAEEEEELEELEDVSEDYAGEEEGEEMAEDEPAETSEDDALEPV